MKTFVPWWFCWTTFRDLWEQLLKFIEILNSIQGGINPQYDLYWKSQFLKGRSLNMQLNVYVSTDYINRSADFYRWIPAGTPSSCSPLVRSRRSMAWLTTECTYSPLMLTGGSHSSQLKKTYEHVTVQYTGVQSRHFSAHYMSHWFIIPYHMIY